MTDHSTTKYIRAVCKKDGHYAAQLYHYDSTGNKIIILWELEGFNYKEEALDAASEYCDEKGIDAETDFS